MQRQPGYLVTSICCIVSAADTLTLLIKASATVTVYRGHRRTLLPSRDGINSLLVMYSVFSLYFYRVIFDEQKLLL